MICPKCGADNLAGKILCYKCGTNLLQAPGGALKGRGKAGRKEKRGCWRGCLTGCLVVILIVIVASVAIWISRERVAKFLLDRMERIAFSIISEEVDKEEVREVIAEVREALERGEFDAEKLEKANRELGRYMKDGKLDKEETDKLMKMFREAIGIMEETATVSVEGETVEKKPLPEKKTLTAEEREEIRRKRKENEANSWLQVGGNFASVEMYDSALEYYQKVVDKYPESEQAQEARKRIEEIEAKLKSK